MTTVYERVYHVTQYEDDPVAGVADYLGQPHIFEKEFDENSDSYVESYRLSPVDVETASLAAERREIVKPWWLAYQRGEVEDAKYRVLSSDLPRFLELERLLAERVRIDPLRVLRRKATFRRDPDFPGVMFPPIQVKWELVTINTILG